VGGRIEADEQFDQVRSLELVEEIGYTGPLPLATSVDLDGNGSWLLRA
jgi:8-oxo-dGTP pyrophosphatase MutT (NUDIX family)